MCCFFLAFNYISLLLLFSRSDHCRQWKYVMRELLEVTLQRHFVRDLSNPKKKKTRSPLRPSALTEIVELMQSRALWPSVMRELVEKYEYKKKNMTPLRLKKKKIGRMSAHLRHDDPLGYRCEFAVVNIAGLFASDSYRIK